MAEQPSPAAAVVTAAAGASKTSVSTMKVAFVTVILLLLGVLLTTQYSLLTPTALIEYYGRFSQHATSVIHRSRLVGLLLQNDENPVLLKDLKPLNATPTPNIATNSSIRTSLLTINNQTYDISLYENRKIEMGCAITTAKIPNINEMKKKQPFFKHLLPSFCSSASAGFMYVFYMSYDFNDPILSKAPGRKAFEEKFDELARQHCKGDFIVGVTFVKCNHTKHPAWAQNDAMIAGYKDGMDYFYMINDDTVIETKDWTLTFISSLSKMKPNNVGMVGPKHTGGNTHILTYHFVHRTHLDIFGYFYPREFTDWYADDWISHIYEPNNVKKIANIKVRHTMEKGQRYAAHTAHGKNLKAELTKSRVILRKYLDDQQIDTNEWFKGLKALR